jgi:hypothetical protein
MITGGKLGSLNYPGIQKIFKRAEGWYLQEFVQVVRFEDLIGPKGGGDPAKQDWIISELLDYLDLNRTPSQVEELKDDLFGGTHTFRAGKIDQWRQDMPSDLYRLVMDEISSIPFIQQLGYTE